ncbi:MAG: glycosyltransferase family 39 protein [Candidatus Omnitrophota bacterium]
MLNNWFDRHIWARRLISSVVTIAFISCAVLDDVWAGVKDGGTSDNLPAISLEENNFRPIKPNKFYLPEHLGRVESFFKGKSKKTVFHIQDAHCNSFAQHKIAEIVDYLKEAHDISVLNLEGASEEFDLDVFTSIKDQEKRREIADYFVKAGEISGPELYAINNPEKVILWGIEDKNLYLENFKAYHNYLKHSEDVNSYLEELTRILDVLKKHIFTQELLELDKMSNEYKAGSLGFREYSSFLIQKAKKQAYPVEKFNNLYLLQQLIDKEKHIDFKKANTERAVIIDKLEKVLSRDEIRELVANIIKFKTEKMSEKKFYKFIIKKARSIGLEIRNFSAVSCYVEYISLYEQIDFLSVSKNIDMLESEIKESLCRNPDQREMIKLSRNLVLMKNIFRIALTSSDYEYYHKNKNSFDTANYLEFIKKHASIHRKDMQINKDIGRLDEYREKIVKFYEYSFKRDKAFLKNLRFADSKTNSENTVLVTGGFHSENLYKLLRKQNISYVAISPKFISEKNYKSPYFDLLAGGQGTNLQYAVSAVIPKISMLALPPKLAPVLSQIVCGNNKVDAFNVSAKLMDREGMTFVLGINDIKLEGDFVVFYMEDGTIVKKPKDYMLTLIEEAISRGDKGVAAKEVKHVNKIETESILETPSEIKEDKIPEVPAREVVFSLKESPGYEKEILNSGMIENEIDKVLEHLQLNLPEKVRNKLYKSVLPGTNWNIFKASIKTILDKKIQLPALSLYAIIAFVFMQLFKSIGFHVKNISLTSYCVLATIVYMLIMLIAIKEKYDSERSEFMLNSAACYKKFILMPIYKPNKYNHEYRDLWEVMIRRSVAHEIIHLLAHWGYVKKDKFWARVIDVLRGYELNPSMLVFLSDITKRVCELKKQKIQDGDLEERVDKLIASDKQRRRKRRDPILEWLGCEFNWMRKKGKIIARYLIEKYPDDNNKRWEYVRKHLCFQKSEQPNRFFRKTNLLLWLILAFSFIIRVWNLNYNVFWMDEGAFVEAGLLRIFNYWTSGMLFTPVVGEFVRTAMKLGFNVVTSARFVNVIFGTAIVFIVFKIAQVFTDKLTDNQKVKEWIPIFAALITAVSPGAWFISRYVAYDAMSYLFFGIGLLPFFKGIHEKKPNYLWLSGALFTLSFATKYVTLIYYPALIIYAITAYYKPGATSLQKQGFIDEIKVRVKEAVQATIEAFPRFILPLLGMTAIYTYKYRDLVVKGIIYSASGTASYFPATTLKLLRMTLVHLTPVILLLGLIGFVKAKDKKTAGWLTFFSAMPLIYHLLGQHRLSIHKLFAMSTMTGLAILAAIPLAVMTALMLKKIAESKTWKKKAWWGTSIPAMIAAMMITIFAWSNYLLVNDYQNWRNTRSAQTFITSKVQKHWKILAFENKWPLGAILYGKVPFENFHEQWQSTWKQHVRNGTYDVIFLDNKNRTKHLEALEIALTSGNYWIAKMDLPLTPSGERLYSDFEDHSPPTMGQLNLMERLSPYYSKNDNHSLGDRAIATYVLLHKNHKPGLDKIKKIQKRKKRKFTNINLDQGNIQNRRNIGKTIPISAKNQSGQNLSKKAKKVDTAFLNKSYQHQRKPGKRTVDRLSGIRSIATIGLGVTGLLFLNVFKSFAGVLSVNPELVELTLMKKAFQFLSQPMVVMAAVKLMLMITAGIILIRRLLKEKEIARKEADLIKQKNKSAKENSQKQDAITKKVVKLSGTEVQISQKTKSASVESQTSKVLKPVYSACSLMGKVYDKNGQLITSGFNVTRDSETHKIVIKHDKLEINPVEINLARDSAPISKETFLSSLKRLLAYDVKSGAIRQRTSTLTVTEKDGIIQMINEFDSTDFTETIALEDHKDIKGCCDSQNKVWYLNKKLINNPQALIHEMGEASDGILPGTIKKSGITALQEFEGKEYNQVITNHTQWRGVGKDVEQAYKELYGAKRMQIPDSLLEIEDVIKSLDQKMIDMGLGNMTESEMALILYNFDQRNQPERARAGNDVCMLFRGVQAHIDAAKNLALTQEIGRMTDVLRRDNLNIVLGRAEFMSRSSQEMWARKGSRKYRKIGVDTLYRPFETLEDLDVKLKEAIDIATRDAKTGKLTKIYVNCLIFEEKEIAEKYRMKYPRVIAIGNDLLDKRYSLEEFNVNVLRLIHFANLVLNDKRLSEDYKVPKDEMIDIRIRMVNHCENCGFLADDVDVDSAFFSEGMTADALEKFMRALYSGNLHVRMTPINWEEVRDYNDGLEEIYRSL